MSMQNIGRADERSAVAAACYRSGETLKRDETGESLTFKRQDRVVHTEMIFPDHAPEWCKDRGSLWNAVEAKETRSNSRLAREFECALPNELSLAEQQELVREWVKEQLTPLGIIADVAIHKRPDGGTPNDHVHVMTTDRPIELDGTWAKNKDRSFNTVEQLEQWRKTWAAHSNAALERAGYSANLDHRSHEARGKAQLPTIHVGYKHAEIAKRGGRSWRVEFNEEIRRTNKQIIADITAKISGLWGKATEAVTRTLTPQAPAQAKPEPAPEPTAKAEYAKQQPTTPALETDDAEALAAMAEAEKRKKDAHSAALAAAIAASHHR